MNLKTQVQSQVDYAQTHKGKAIGSVVGLIAGVSYGLAGKKDNWMVSGLAIVGLVAGAIVGGMFEKQPAIVVATDNGDGKSPVVDDTSMMDVNDTAGEDGVMGVDGRGRRKNYNVSGAFVNGKCYCGNSGSAVTDPSPQGHTACQQACSPQTARWVDGVGVRSIKRTR